MTTAMTELAERIEAKVESLEVDLSKRLRILEARVNDIVSRMDKVTDNAELNSTRSTENAVEVSCLEKATSPVHQL